MCINVQNVDVTRKINTQRPGFSSVLFVQAHFVRDVTSHAMKLQNATI